MINIESNYKKFIKYLQTYVKRDGIDRFIEWLGKTDIDIAPASTKYHMSCDGGLVQHSLNVFMRLISLLNNEYPTTAEGVDTCPYSKESIALVALLHDISKVGYYKKIYKNVKNDETGNWEKVQSYAVKDEDARLLYATHEENSVYILSKFFKLTYDEELAIRYHMGSIDAEDSFAQNRMLSAYKHCPLALFLHIADMQAMCIDEYTALNNNAELTPQKEVVFDERNTKTANTETDSDIPF